VPGDSSHTIVIGLGNPERGDDAVGRVVARRLNGRLPDDVTVSEHDGEPATLLSMLEGKARAILVDACLSGGAPGTVKRLDAAAAALPDTNFSVSTHALGLAEAIELARALGQLPPVCIVYAVELGGIEHGAALSPAVEAAVDEVCALIRDEVDEGVPANA